MHIAVWMFHFLYAQNKRYQISWHTNNSHITLSQQIPKFYYTYWFVFPNIDDHQQGLFDWHWEDIELVFN